MRSRFGSEGDPGDGRLPTEAAPVSRLARDSPTPGDPRQLSSQASRSSCWPWSRRAARTRRTVVVGLTSLAAESLGLAVRSARWPRGYAADLVVVDGDRLRSIGR